MAFEKIKENAEAIQENAKAYIETSLAYYKLRVFKVVVKSLVSLFNFFLIVACLIIFLIFVSVGGALLLGEYYGSYPLGFFIVAVIYLVLSILLYVMKGKIVQGSFFRMFSDIFFKD